MSLFVAAAERGVGLDQLGDEEFWIAALEIGAAQICHAAISNLSQAGGPIVLRRSQKAPPQT